MHRSRLFGRVRAEKGKSGKKEKGHFGLGAVCEASSRLGKGKYSKILIIK